MPYRHPAVLANMAATVDHISGSRLILGLGAAWNEMECEAYGIPLPPLKERFDRFDEGVEAIIALLSQTVANYDGQYVQLTDARCEPSRCSARTRRSPSAATAASAPCAPPPATRRSGTRPRRTRPSTPSSRTCCAGTARGRPGLQRDHLLVPAAQRRRGPGPPASPRWPRGGTPAPTSRSSACRCTPSRNPAHAGRGPRSARLARAGPDGTSPVTGRLAGGWRSSAAPRRRWRRRGLRRSRPTP